MDHFQDLAVIKLSRFEGNTPTQLNALQSALTPYLTSLELVWWCIWWSVLAYLITRYMILPQLSARTARAASSEPSAVMIGDPSTAK